MDKDKEKKTTEKPGSMQQRVFEKMGVRIKVNKPDDNKANDKKD